MKKIFVFIMLLITLSCSSQNDGAKNACQYVREQMNDQAENIKSMEVVREDSVLDPYIAILNNNDDWQEKLDAQHSWIMMDEYCDSLKQLPKYKDKWHKAYIIEVTMKSSKVLTYRVCMEKNGITPQMTAQEFLDKLK